MDASLSPSALSDDRVLRTRAEREEHLDRVGQQFADLLATALNRVASRAWERFVESLGPRPDSLVASGDFTVFADVASYWTEVMSVEILPVLQTMYLEGALGAWLASPLTGGLPASTALSWTNIVNETAAQYARDASNRLVGVGDTVWKDLANRAGAAIERGASTEQLKEEIEQITGFTEFRADTIARTEIGKAFVAGDRAANKGLAEYGPVEKVWVATLDDRTRDTHADLHDTWVPIDEPFDVGGSPMDVPLDDAGPAEEVVNCRCYVDYLYVGDLRPDGSVVEAADSVEFTIDEDDDVEEQDD